MSRFNMWYRHRFERGKLLHNVIPPAEPLPGGAPVDDGSFETPVTQTTVTGAIKLSGKKTAGSSGKFIVDIGAIAANTVYTVQYDPDFSALAQQGKLAAVGFGLKSGNNFHLATLKGNGTTGLNVAQITGANFAATTGQTVTTVKAAANGTQAGPNWIQLQTSADGSTYALRTSADGVTWTDEITGATPSPLAGATSATSYGIAAFFDGADAGNFSIDVSVWRTAVAPAVPYRYVRMLPSANNGANTVGLSEFDVYDAAGVRHTGGTVTTKSTVEGSAASLRDGDLSTYWLSGINDVTAWVQVDFGAGNAKTIGSFALVSKNDSNGPGQAPKDFLLQVSNDGTTWTNFATVTGEVAWFQGERRFYTASGRRTASAGATQKVRLVVISTPMTAASIAEVQYTLAGVDQTSPSGTASGNPAHLSAAPYTPASAFDNDNNTRWGTVSTGQVPTYLDYDAGAGNSFSFDSVKLRASNDWPNQMPSQFEIHVWNAAAGAYDFRYRSAVLASWTANEERTFDLNALTPMDVGYYTKINNATVTSSSLTKTAGGALRLDATITAGGKVLLSVGDGSAVTSKAVKFRVTALTLPSGWAGLGVITKRSATATFMGPIQQGGGSATMAGHQLEATTGWEKTDSSGWDSLFGGWSQKTPVFWVGHKEIAGTAYLYISTDGASWTLVTSTTVFQTPATDAFGIGFFTFGPAGTLSAEIDNVTFGDATGLA